MSRGLGKIEREILKELKRPQLQRPLTANEVRAFLLLPKKPSKAVAVRRALGSLERKGLVVRVKPDWPTASRAAWKLSYAESRKTHKRRRAQHRNHESEALRYAHEHLKAQGAEKERLAKLLGMLSSNHDGEILNAAKMIEAERKRLDQTWAEIFSMWAT